MDRIENDEEGGGFARRHWIKLVGAALVFLVLVGFFARDHKEPRAYKPASAQQVVAVTLPPPPPPPPPPPRPREPRPEQQEQKMIAQEAVAEPDEAPSESPAPSDAALGTGVVGSGPADGFGLGTAPGGGGGFYGGTGGSPGGPGNAWGRYGYQAQTSIQNALTAHPRTRALELDARLRVWVDADGRIERVELGRSVDPEEAAAVREALLGVALGQAAPSGMPQPIVLRLNARRPGIG